MQITTLVNYRERPIKSEKTRQLIAQLSRALQSAIERFVSVGEKIALEHAEIKYEMLDVCVRVRQAGESAQTRFIELWQPGENRVDLCVCVYFPCSKRLCC